MKGMKNIIFTIFISTMLIFGIYSNTYAVGSGHSYYRAITIDHTKVPNTDQTNFPVLVSGTYTYLKTVANGGSVQNSSGYDIGFYSDSDLTTALNWEIEKYSPTTGAVAFWVKVPTVSHTTDTTIYMAYGNSSISTFQGGATGSVWDANYLSVIHMGDGTSITTTDSTTNAKNATNSNATATTGQIGGAANFTGTQHMTMANIASMGDFTIDVWSMYTSTSGIVFSMDNYPTSPRASVVLNAQCYGCSNQLVWNTYDAANHGADHLLAPATVSAFNKFTIKRSGSTSYLFINDVQTDTITGVSAAFTFQNIHLGAQYHSGNIQDHIVGKIDEFRISNTYRSNDWNTASYNNESSPNTFYTVGSEVVLNPIVTSDAESSVTSTTVTLNGTIENAGASSPTVRGFYYGLTDSYGTTVSTEGTYSAGAYTYDLTGLTCSTTYHYKAFATNSYGTGTGSDQTLTTALCAGTLTTESASNLTRTTATLTGTITSTGGEDNISRGFQYGLTNSYGTTTTEAGTFKANPVYSTQFGSSGSGDEQFSNPRRMARDSSGNIYVVDVSNNRIKKHTASGTFVSEFGSSGSGDGQFSTPTGIAVDSNGNVYVVDQAHYRIEKFNSAGVYVSEFGIQGTGEGLAIDSNNNIYVVDSTNNRVQKYTSGGVYVSRFGSTGTGNGQFSSPTGIHIDSDGYIYVVDTGNDRIQKFESSGDYSMKFGSTGTGNGQFDAPKGVYTDYLDYIYVVDSGNNRIQKFDSSGNYVMQFGSAGTGNGELDTPIDMFIDSEHSIYVSDAGNDRIQKFTDDTIFTVSLTDLVCNTTYHYRSYSSHNYNTGYGSDGTFTTSSCAVASGGGGGGVFSYQLNTQNTLEVKKTPTENKKEVENTIPQFTSFTFTRKTGDRARDVYELQKFLNKQGFLVAKKGPGSVGKETIIFSKNTKNALIKFQKANKIKPANGILGPQTRKVINSLNK